MVKGVKADFFLKYLSEFKSSPFRLSSIFFLFFFFSFSSLSAQDSLNIPEDGEARISIVDFARIYSSDPDFNKQLADGNVKLENAVSQPVEAGKIIVISVEDTLKFSKKIKVVERSAEEKTKAKIIEEVKEKIQSNSFSHLPLFRSGTSSEKISYSKNGSQKGFVLSASKYEQSRAILVRNSDILRLISLLLSKQNNSDYTSSSKRIYFSSKAHVRPPPVLV